LLFRYYKSLRSDLLIKAFKKDAVMIKAAEDALTAFLDSPLKFGMIFTGARAEAWRLKPIWRLKSYWHIMFADHINSILAERITEKNPGSIHSIVTSVHWLADHIDPIIRGPGASAGALHDSLSRLSDALNLCVLMTNNWDFFRLLGMHFRASLLNCNPVAVFQSLLLKNFVFSRLKKDFNVYHIIPSLSAIEKLLADYTMYTVYELPGGRHHVDVCTDDTTFVLDFERIFDGKTGLEFSFTWVEKKGKKALPRRDVSPLHSLDVLPETYSAQFRYLSWSGWNEFIEWPAW
jgi:hypothetical protein